MARNQKETTEEIKEDKIDADHEDLRVYELGFHIDPELPQEEVKKVFNGIKEAILQEGQEIAMVEPEKISLAYTISRTEHTGRHDFSASFFAWIAYEATGQAHQNVGDVVRKQTNIFRFIDILTTKEAALHSAEQHKMRKHTEKAKPQEEDVVSDEQLDAALAAPVA